MRTETTNERNTKKHPGNAENIAQNKITLSLDGTNQPTSHVLIT